MMVKKDEIANILKRNVVEVIERGHLEKRLVSGEKLRVKHGIDPTGPKIHIGRAGQFWKLKELQDLGHKIVLIIGDYTALIGDASDKQSTRPVVSEKEIKKNMKDYENQIGKILDIKKTELRYNSEWLNKLSVKKLLKIASSFTVQQLIHRRNFKERWDQEKEIGLHELTYPLFQGYDSVMVKADLEIGGTDQLFNLLAGRKIQEIFGYPPQDVMTLKMLIGLDGRKMSTSWGNVINILDEPCDMFGKVMSMKDEMISEYFEFATNLSSEKIDIIKNESKNKMDMKNKLAFEIVKIYHGEKKAGEAQDNFVSVFQKGGLPEDVKEIKSRKGDELKDILMGENVLSSLSEFRRLAKEGAIDFEGEKISDVHYKTEKSGVVRIGKKKFVKIIVP